MNAFGVKDTGIWDGHLRWSDGGQIREAGVEFDELGYSALWFPRRRGDIMEASETLLAATRRTVMATRKLDVWLHDATQVAEPMGNWSDDWRRRFVLGLGISHRDVVESERYRNSSGRCAPLRLAALLDGPRRLRSDQARGRRSRPNNSWACPGRPRSRLNATRYLVA
jgi:hypothetical protein